MRVPRLSHVLNSVRVEKSPVLAAHDSDLLYRLAGAHFVIRHHDGNQTVGMPHQLALQFVEANASLAVHG